MKRIFSTVCDLSDIRGAPFKLLPQEMQQGAKLFEEMYTETAKAMGYEI